MAETVKLFVNGVEVEVEKGKNLIDAIGAVGIEIPHLCYHPALGADGNCRMCLVGIEDGRPPLVPACKTPAMEGMKVLLDAEHIRKIQHDVMEFELINHPIDCPVCDQAGECKLQDYYMSYDQKPSRMTVPPVAKNKKLDFGCGVVHDQERCVVCGRCVRFCRQITKTGELGIINRTDAARVNIFPGRPLNNRYALNVVDLCPVGAMTSKDFRFKQRVWFLQKSPSVCHGCSKGCSIYIDHNREKYKDDVIYRFRPRLNAEVNGYFMCDEGRMTYKFENENRIASPRYSQKQVTMEEILATAKREISQAEKVAFIVSPNATLEQITAVKALAESKSSILCGYSDGYIKPGDGDEYLIQDDKAANRAGLVMLGIDTSQAGLEKVLQDCQVVVNFNNDLSLSYPEGELKKLFSGKRVIGIFTNDNRCCALSEILIPAASYSEYSGTIVNCDGIVQCFAKAVTKNNELPELACIASALGGPLSDNAAILSELNRLLPQLCERDSGETPANGPNPNESEAANVSA